MFKQFRKKSKLVATVMSAAFVATAFTSPGGCTVTLDEELFQQVLGWAEDLAGSGYVEAEWGYGPGGPGPQGGPGQYGGPGQQGGPCPNEDQDWSYPEPGE